MYFLTRVHANAFRVILTVAAYVLLQELRRRAADVGRHGAGLDAARAAP